MSLWDEPFENLLSNLCDERAPLRAAVFYRLSDPTQQDMASLRANWSLIPAERRRLLLSRMAETSESNFDLDFTAVAHLALEDTDAEVRVNAIKALWTDESIGFLRRLLNILQGDPSPEVRATAASGLGHFVWLGEIDELDETLLNEVVDALLQTYQSTSEPLEVRRRALEGASYSCREDILPLIEAAYQHSDLKMRASAMFAMGRNGHECWEATVMRGLTDAEPEIRYEAVRAAGEMSLKKAAPRLIELARDPDREIKEMAIWSLGEVGGSAARKALHELAEEEIDEDLLEQIEDALGMANLPSLFDPDEDDPDFKLDLFNFNS